MGDERDHAVLQAFNNVGGDDPSYLRLFSRAASGCFIIGSWAGTVAREYVKSTAVLKNWGGIDAIVVNDTIAREVIRDCLLHRGVSVEFYDKQTSGGPYTCVQRGSPGHIADFEATLFAFEEAEIQLMAVGAVVIGDNINSKVSRSAGQCIRVGFAALNTTLRTLTYAEYRDSPQLTNLDVLMAQCNLKQLMYFKSDVSLGAGGRMAGVPDGAAEQSDTLRTLKQICERANVVMREYEHNNLGHGSQGSSGSKRATTASTGSLLNTLEEILRVPEDRHSLKSFPLASRGAGETS
uniref:Uncharacterized protein TCIL3000_10_9230 n=1 Tax=Trypanosoma congolense (strain IL3000) TaxID=1068625 RepID=G0UXM8_TRYCI|nr:unnamed protein product [Trypanosoma congolense IL3000]